MSVKTAYIFDIVYQTKCAECSYAGQRWRSIMQLPALLPLISTCNWRDGCLH